MDDLIVKRFLSVTYGYGYGYGYGSGSGDDDGSGHVGGSGYGYGYGDDDGSGVISFLGNTAYMVDSIPTIFYSVKSNYAKCAIIQKDLTLKQCFVAKVGNYFAHGSTLKEAFADANAKYMQNLPEEERIRMFEEKFDVNGEYPIRDFYDWHNILTGSCRFGRDSFAQQHGIDLNGIMSVVEFIKLTKNAYRGEIIKKLYGGVVLNM